MLEKVSTIEADAEKWIHCCAKPDHVFSRNLLEGGLQKILALGLEKPWAL